MCYNGLLSRATDLLPARPFYASPPGCPSNSSSLHPCLLALLHSLHSAAKERSASPSPSITSRLFAKTAGVPSPAFPDFSPGPALPRPISGHFLHFSHPERSTSPSLSIIYTLFCGNTGMPACRISGGALLSPVNSRLCTYGPP